MLGLVIPLVTKYGIALEAHLQNAIATFRKDGLLDTMYIRDFEGLRIDKVQLNEMGCIHISFSMKNQEFLLIQKRLCLTKPFILPFKTI